MDVEVAPYWNVNINEEETEQDILAVEVAPYWNVNF